jgi:hypothetical protein
VLQKVPSRRIKMTESEKIFAAHTMGKFTAEMLEKGLITPKQHREWNRRNDESLAKLPQKFVGIAT